MLLLNSIVREFNMEKNNKLKIIISSIFLLVIVSTAAFAYFGSFNINVNNNVAVNIITEDPGEATFVSNATFLNLQVPALNMNAINSNNEIEAAKNEAVLNVTLKGHNNVLTVCSFDIVFEYDLGSNIYGDEVTYKTSGADKEITMQVVSNSGTNHYENETNFYSHYGFGHRPRFGSCRGDQCLHRRNILSAGFRKPYGQGILRRHHVRADRPKIPQFEGSCDTIQGNLRRSGIRSYGNCRLHILLQQPLDCIVPRDTHHDWQ